ncbi:YSIRK-type signal peptide-containing protein [Kitasatospora sp. NPDC003701]
MQCDRRFSVGICSTMIGVMAAPAAASPRPFRRAQEGKDR